jgi:hypothetical protein
VVDGLEAVDVLHEVSADVGLRSTLWFAQGTNTSRRISALRALVEQLLPDLRYRGVSEYRVISQTGERLDLQPVRVSLGMPILRRVRVRPGVPGARADHALGSLVLVAFVDSDPARPAVIGFSDAESAGFQPTRLDLGESETVAGGVGAAGRALRYGDPVMVTSWAGGVAGAPGTELPLTLVAPPIIDSALSKVYP